MMNVRFEMRILLVLVCLLLAPIVLQAETLAITGGTVHPISGDPFAGTVVVSDGLITAAGPDAQAPADARIIDATGKHVYPGMIDAMSQLGLLEIGAVSATDDQAELGLFNPHLQAATAIHPSSELIPVARANGITHTLVAPQVDDGIIAGQAALIHLDGWTVEEMALDPAIAMVVRWPEIETRSFDFTTFSMKETPYNEAKEKAEEKRQEVRQWLEAAQHYGQAMEAGSARLETDLKLETLAQWVADDKLVIVRADSKADIESAIEYSEKIGFRMILAGGRDAWKVKEQLAEKQIPVILGIIQSLPFEDDEPYDMPARNPVELVEAGVKIAFASGAGGGFGPGGPHNSRTTPYEAATAVGYGLSEEDAMKALTLWPAEFLGFGDRLGSIETGKIANLIVTDGSPLEITTQIEHLVINGREVSTDNMHERLYEKYRSRPLPATP
jgi:imidazolonepropionase-like amidohydrolase